jgi:hypothetical protein
VPPPHKPVPAVTPVISPCVLAFIVSTSPTTDVVTFVPPEIVKVSLLLSATAVPESDATFLNMF